MPPGSGFDSSTNAASGGFSAGAAGILAAVAGGAGFSLLDEMRFETQVVTKKATTSATSDLTSREPNPPPSFACAGAAELLRTSAAWLRPVSRLERGFEPRSTRRLEGDDGREPGDRLLGDERTVAADERAAGGAFELTPSRTLAWPP